jgi:membrane-bound serine protease (ClpP class)
MPSEIAILAGVGLLLLALEVILPGAILGFAGVSALLLSLVLTFTSSEMEAYSVSEKMAFAGGIIVVAILFMLLWLRYFEKLPFLRNYVLDTAIKNPEKIEDPESLVGKIGKTRSALRPAGQAIFDGRRLEVFAENGIIQHNRPICVVKVDGFRIIVREVVAVPDEIMPISDEVPA